MLHLLTLLLIRIINVVKTWVDGYWLDFNNNVELLDYLLQFIDELRTSDFDAERSDLEQVMMHQVFVFSIFKFKLTVFFSLVANVP